MFYSGSTKRVIEVIGYCKDKSYNFAIHLSGNAKPVSTYISAKVEALSHKTQAQQRSKGFIRVQNQE